MKTGLDAKSGYGFELFYAVPALVPPSVLFPQSNNSSVRRRGNVRMVFRFSMWPRDKPATRPALVWRQLFHPFSRNPECRSRFDGYISKEEDTAVMTLNSMNSKLTLEAGILKGVNQI